MAERSDTGPAPSPGEAPAPPPVIAAFEHLTGRSRGSVSWLGADVLDAWLSAAGSLRIAEPHVTEPTATPIARLHRVDSTYEIEAAPGQCIWINRVAATTRRLADRDMVEFGEKGPLSRFHLYPDRQSSRKTLFEILCDCTAYLKSSRRPLSKRSLRALSTLFAELTSRTTLVFRTAVILAIAALAYFVYQQQESTRRIEQTVETEASRLKAIGAALNRARQEALTPSDLAVLRKEMTRELGTATERLAALERRSDAAVRVIPKALPHVVFLQSGYGYRHRPSGRMLRYVVDDTGAPMISPTGQPLLALESDGPVAEISVIGTAFVMGGKGVLVTNRHVAIPWDSDSAPALRDEELEPVVTKRLAYFPGRREAVPVEIVRLGKDVDLALLRQTEGAPAETGLKLSGRDPGPGDEVFVMGYPTGLRSILVQAGPAFLEQLQSSGKTDFWHVAKALAADGHIVPLASRGIVARSTVTAVIYDAETTHGGSGGPVLDVDGKVIAVNTAVLPEFGGSNIGIPASQVRELLQQAGF